MRRKTVFAIMLTFLFISMLTSAFNIQQVKASETIYIRADGSIDPSTAPIQRDGNVYTLTGNTQNSIVVQRDNVVIEGGGYTIQGSDMQGIGIILSGRINVTINNFVIKEFGDGIILEGSSNNSISGNRISDTHNGIYLVSSSNHNNIIGNTVTNNRNGIYVDYSSNNSISRNVVTENSDGIYLDDSSGNSLDGNILIGNSDSGIHTRRSSKNYIQSNNIKENYEGIGLWKSSSNNVISGNYLENNSPYGIALWNEHTSNNSIFENIMTSNNWGVYLEAGCNDNNVFGNNLIRNSLGASIWKSSGNKLYHNNFLNNTQQALLHHSGQLNIWDDGYPSGGNHWSNYSGEDANLDGIGDTSYIIDAGNIDRYPLMIPWQTTPNPPVAHFKHVSNNLRVGKEITFNASSSFGIDQEISSYLWDFGDSNTTLTDDSVATHTYDFPGRYTITLTVSDNESLNSSFSQTRLVKMPASVSMSTSSPSTLIGYKVTIAGALRDIYGKGLENEKIVLHYSFSGIHTWTPITSITTDNLGHYNAMWIPPATGYFTIKAEWNGNATHIGTTNTTTLNSLAYENQYVFSVESNSTVSSLAFNSTSLELSFTVSGQTGSTGYVKVTVAKDLVEDVADIRVHLNGNQVNYTATSLDDSWLLYFTYQHSAHSVTVSLGSISGSFIEIPVGILVATFLIPIIASAIIILFIWKKKQSHLSPPTPNKRRRRWNPSLTVCGGRQLRCQLDLRV